MTSTEGASSIKSSAALAEYALKEEATRVDSREHITPEEPGFTVTDQWDARPERAEEREEHSEDGRGVYRRG